MEKGEKISIIQCGNGFLVTGEKNAGEYWVIGDCFVFQTMSELVTFIEHHFEHRCAAVKTDLCGRLDD